VPEHPTEVRLTDSGRQVTGGGGITPDIIVTAPKLNKFQQLLLQSDALFPAETGVGGFTRYYMGTKPAITRDFEVDDNLMMSFRQFLAKKNVRYAEADFAENMDWTKRKIKQEVFMSAFGQQEGFKVLLEGDNQVRAAVDAIPQARALYQNVKKIIAQRSGAAVEQP
jgi:carboxyl-terminal processing protease